jgi:hypothetical protein
VPPFAQDCPVKLVTGTPFEAASSPKVVPPPEFQIARATGLPWL